MKKAIAAAAAIACAATITLCGCANKVSVTNNYYTMSDAQFQTYLDELASGGASVESLLEVSSQRSVFSNVSIQSFVPYLYTATTGSYFTKDTLVDAVYSGSGVIVDLDKESGDAYVLTNCHLVYDDSASAWSSTYGCYAKPFSTVATRVYLYLYGQDIEGVNYTLGYMSDSYGNYPYYKYDCSDDANYRMEASIISLSVQYDLALLKVTGSTILKNSNAVAATFAEDDEVYAGQACYAVGNPLGDGTTVTSGVVSQDSIYSYLNVSSSVYTLYRQIKTDAAVNGGNSGGGFYNARGELIGIINSKLEDESVDNSAYALAGSYIRRLYRLMLDTASGDAITSSSGTGLSRPYLKGAYTDNTQYYYDYGAKVQFSIDTGYDTAYSYAYLDTSGTIPKARIVEEVAATTTSYGLAKGDVITHLTITDTAGNNVEDLDITRKYLLDDALLSYRNGYTVTLTYVHGDDDPATKNVECQWYSVI